MPVSAGAHASPSALEAARAEIDRAVERLEQIHPEPFHAIDRAAFVSELQALKERLPSLEPEQAAVELMRTWALLSTERDGHQFALPLDVDGEPVLPIRVYEFAEGVFVTDAMQPYGDLVGTRLMAVGDTAIDEVLDRLEPLVPRDGPATVPSFRPLYLLRPAVLRGLGLVDSGPVPVSVSGPDGSARTVELQPVSGAEFREWAGWLPFHGLAPRAELRHTRHTDPNFALEPMRDGEVLYVRFSRVASVPSGAIEELRRLAAAPQVERVIVDLRQNTGGNNTTFGNLLAALGDPSIDQPGRLVVLIDRVTFSAAANFATRLEQATHATFAGEPMGGGLNFWNDVTWIELPDFPLPMRLAISTRYWEMAEPDDPRLSIEPDLPMAVTAADYFAGRDPLLEAALEDAGGQR
ncbi:MAG TPA: hypothetical protein VF071_04805 [Candidatus Limnocylindria bacterium]